MKVCHAALDRNGKVELRESSLPELKNGEARLKIHASLLSPGTEMKTVLDRRKNPAADDLDFFGYSAAGEVIETKGDCKDIKAGMRVAAMGSKGASHANYGNVPVNMLVPIPDNVSYSQATYACLGATALQSVRRTRPQLGEFGLVLGLGIVGNLAGQFCQLSGARVMALESLGNRIAIAQKCGLRTVNFLETDVKCLADLFSLHYGMDFAIFAFGGDGNKAFESVKDCMKLSADGHRMGRITLVGGCMVSIRGGAGTGNMDILSSARTGPGYHDEAYEYGRDYPAAFIQFTTQRNLREIIALISEKRLKVDELTTHTAKLRDIPELVELLIEHPDEALGCIMEMEH